MIIGGTAKKYEIWDMSRNGRCRNRMTSYSKSARPLLNNFHIRGIFVLEFYSHSMMMTFECNGNIFWDVVTSMYESAQIMRSGILQEWMARSEPQSVRWDCLLTCVMDIFVRSCHLHYKLFVCIALFGSIIKRSLPLIVPFAASPWYEMESSRIADTVSCWD